MLEQLAMPLLFTSLAGLATGVGGLIILFVRQPSNTFLAFSLGISAGVMIVVSFVELLNRAIIDVGFLPASVAFYLGMLVIFAIDMLVPHTHMGDEHHHGSADAAVNKRLHRTGMLVALGMVVHNFPEGMVVLLSTMESVSLGVALTLAVAIHNIPEGIAVAVPIYHATGKRGKAIAMAVISGLSEPAGALFGAIFVVPFLPPGGMAYVLAFVAGIMVFISLDELLPSAHKYGDEHLVILGIIAGMVIMSISLALLN